MQTQYVFSVGLDVDDKQFHGVSICVSTGEVENFCCSPNAGALIKRLKKISSDPARIRICYEAGYLGFSLYRELVKAGFHCDVIAPSQTPEKRGDKVKTDRLDAEKLARYYLGGFLTIVNVPDFEQEMDRDLVRSRKFHVEQLTALKLHIKSQTRRLGWHFKEATRGKKSWSDRYLRWLRAQVNEPESASVKANFEMLLFQYDSLVRTIVNYDKQIAELCEKPAYKEAVKALKAYRGISELTAVLLCTELGDMRRFSHPKQVTSYAGLDIIESSSGGRERKFSSSKDGNKHVRTAVIEACQTCDRRMAISRPLKIRRTGVEQKYIDIADRCMARLNEKSRRLLARGKHRNKVKVACAREMLSFIWESMRSAAV